MGVLTRLRCNLRRWASRIRNAAVDQTIILVYSMGKVGSSSVYHSLRLKLPYASIFHVHFLSDHWLNERLPNADSFFHDNIKLGKRIREFIARHSNCRLKVITLVREPVMRDLSGLFENWVAHFDKADEDVGVVLSKMQAHTHEYSLNWFDTEFRNFMNFDIYKTPFDRERGYSIYRLEGADILCIRVEDLDRVASQAFYEFMSLRGFMVVHKNRADQKDRSQLYRLVKEQYVAEKGKLASLYSSKYVRHFYTQKEIDDFFRKWTKSA